MKKTKGDVGRKVVTIRRDESDVLEGAESSVLDSIKIGEPLRRSPAIRNRRKKRSASASRPDFGSSATHLVITGSFVFQS